MTDNSPAHESLPPVSPELDSYDAKSAVYDRLTSETTIRNKAAVFDSLTKAGISTVTVTFDGYGDSGQIEDIQAETESTPVDLPASLIECEEVSWGETEPKRAFCALSNAIEQLTYHYLGTTHGGWEDNDGAYGDFTFDTATREITLAFNERITDSIYSEHSF